MDMQQLNEDKFINLISNDARYLTISQLNQGLLLLGQNPCSQDQAELVKQFQEAQVNILPAELQLKSKFCQDQMLKEEFRQFEAELAKCPPKPIEVNYLDFEEIEEPIKDAPEVDLMPLYKFQTERFPIQKKQFQVKNPKIAFLTFILLILVVFVKFSFKFVNNPLRIARNINGQQFCTFSKKPHWLCFTPKMNLSQENLLENKHCESGFQVFTKEFKLPIGCKIDHWWRKK